MKRVSSSNGMRKAPPRDPLGPSTTRLLDFNLSSPWPHRNGLYPQYHQTHLRTSVPRSLQVCRINSPVCPHDRFWFTSCISHSRPSRAETQQQPLPPPRKLWYDKFADALLGEDESPVNAAASRYALICHKCFTHNGLVKEDMWEDARTHHPLLRILSDVDGVCW